MKTLNSKNRPGASQDYLALYIDSSERSRKAQELLDAAHATLTQAGASLFVTDGPVEPLEEKPLVLYRGGVFQGLEDIQGLIELLNFWNKEEEYWKRLRAQPAHALA